MNLSNFSFNGHFSTATSGLLWFFSRSFNGLEMGLPSPYSDWAPGFEFRQRQETFLLPDSPDWLREPPTILFNVHHRPFLVVRRPEFDVDHSSPSIAEVRNKWSYTSTPECLHGVDKDKLWRHTNYIALLRPILFTDMNADVRTEKNNRPCFVWSSNNNICIRASECSYEETKAVLLVCWHRNK